MSKKLLLIAGLTSFLGSIILLPSAVFAAYSVTIVDTVVTDLGAVIFRIINYILAFTGALAVLFIIIGGLQYITATGNVERAKKARQTLTYAVIGLIIVLLSYLIVTVVITAVETVT